MAYVTNMQICELLWYILANEWFLLCSCLQCEGSGSRAEGRAYVSTSDHPVSDEEATDEMLSPERYR